MGELRFERVPKGIENSNFDCGISSINEDVKHSYYPHILQHAYTYSIIVEDIVVGYTQIMFRDIELTDLPEDIAEYESEVKDNKVTAVHIRFIAIRKEYQRKKFGTNILRIIIAYVRQLTQMWPVRIITIDARLNLMEWYKKEGFLDMVHNKPGQEGVTQAMFMDCMRYEEELSEYIDSLQ